MMKNNLINTKERFQMRKKAVALILIPALLLTGCWDAREINELAFVLSVGLDKTNDGFKVTAQIASPETYSKTPSGTASQATKPFWIVTSNGKTIFEAIRNMASISSRRIFWAHIKVIVISEELAKTNIQEVCDFFTRNPELRLRTLVAVTPGKAGEVVQNVPEMEKDPASYLEKIIENKNLTGKSSSIMLKDFLQDYLNPHVGPVASRIIFDKSGKETVLKTSGAYVFDGNKLAGSLNEEQTRGLLWIKNKMKNSIMVVYCPDDNKPVTMEIKSAKSKMDCYLENKVPCFTIKVDINANITEQACLTDFNEDEKRYKLSKTLETAVRKDIETTIKTAKSMQVDFVDFSGVLHRQHKEEWHDISSDWNNIFPNSEVTIAVNVHINHVSLAKPLEPMKEQ